MTKERCEFEIYCKQELKRGDNPISVEQPTGNYAVLLNFNDREFEILIPELKDKDIYETFNFIVDELKIKLKQGLKK